MKPLKPLLLALGLWFAAPVYATTYICLLDGKPVYTTQRQGLQACRVSQMDGIAENPSATFAEAPQVSAETALPASPATADEDTAQSDAITQIWQRHEYGSFDHTPILPPLPKPAPVKIPPAAPAATKKPQQPRPRAHTIVPPPKPPNRRDILANEISRENKALAQAQRDLQAAQKRQDHAAVRRLHAIVRDREANIRALQQEWKR